MVFFEGVERIGIGGSDDLSFSVYDPNRMVMGKRMEDHLRIAVCYWHSFAWPGSDVFGAGTFDRPWIGASDPMA
ncbi:MAG: xylose isomerase, partial [Acidimicrobiia bacterium]|nr:xylose isomerase [Acidimicrobiia bacterium]